MKRPGIDPAYGIDGRIRREVCMSAQQIIGVRSENRSDITRQMPMDHSDLRAGEFDGSMPAQTIHAEIDCGSLKVGHRIRIVIAEDEPAWQTSQHLDNRRRREVAAMN